MTALLMLVLPLQVALDVQVGERLGRLVLGLYGNVVPKTVSRRCERVEGLGLVWGWCTWGAA